jgi:hypothetical protein
MTTDKKTKFNKIAQTVAIGFLGFALGASLTTWYFTFFDIHQAELMSMVCKSKGGNPEFVVEHPLKEETSVYATLNCLFNEE